MTERDHLNQLIAITDRLYSLGAQSGPAGVSLERACTFLRMAERELGISRAITITGKNVTTDLPSKRALYDRIRTLIYDDITGWDYPVLHLLERAMIEILQAWHWDEAATRTEEPTSPVIFDYTTRA